MARKSVSELTAGETNMKALMMSMGQGCVYNRWDESENRINPADGHLQVRTRTCREVKDCKDSSENVPKICADWSDWHNT